MKKIIIVSVLTILSTVSEFYAQGSDYHLGFRIAPRISTLGAGLEVAKGFSLNFGVRAGFNYFSYGYDATESDVSYDLDLELNNFAILADWHPFEGAFRVSGGILLNGNGLTGLAKPTAPVAIGNANYDLTSVNLDISYNSVAPYFGLGWDTTFGDDDNWGFAFDLGLIYSGSPDTTLNVSGPDEANPLLADDLNRERQELQSDLDTLKWWPVVSAGVVYQF